MRAGAHDYVLKDRPLRLVTAILAVVVLATAFNGVTNEHAIGKAFLVYLGSGSILAAIVAYLVFAGMGC